MPSPFPGMNPYLEQPDVWQDFHNSMIPAVRDALVTQLGSEYIVRIGEHLPTVEFEEHLFLELRDRKKRDLIAVLEMLSPTNKKPGADREVYLAKRKNLFRSTAHFVEIDLLRGWPRMPIEEAKECDYCIMVSRCEDRPKVHFWPLGLRDTLPTIPIPVRPPHGNIELDLQAVLHEVYDRARYENNIYQESPTPPLKSEDAEWAASLIPS